MERIKELYRKYREVISYLVFGVLTTVVSLVVYYGLVFTILDPENALQLQVANVVSWIVAVAFAYVTNRKYVFESTNKNKLQEVAKFVLSRVSTLGLDMLIMFVGVTWLKGDDKIIKIVSQVLVIVGNYVLSKLFVFKAKGTVKNSEIAE